MRIAPKGRPLYLSLLIFPFAEHGSTLWLLLGAMVPLSVGASVSVKHASNALSLICLRMLNLSLFLLGASLGRFMTLTFSSIVAVFV